MNWMMMSLIQFFKKYLQFVCLFLGSLLLSSLLAACTPSTPTTQVAVPASSVGQSNSPKLVVQLQYSDFEADTATAVKNLIMNKSPKYGEKMTENKPFFNHASGESYKVLFDWTGTKLIHSSVTFPDGKSGVYSYWLDENQEPRFQSSAKIEGFAVLPNSFELNVSSEYIGNKGDEFYCFNVKKVGSKIGAYSCLPISQVGNKVIISLPDHLSYLRDLKPADISIYVNGTPEIGF